MMPDVLTYLWMLIVIVWEQWYQADGRLTLTAMGKDVSETYVECRTVSISERN